MTTSPGPARRQLPEPLAQRLRALNGTDNGLLNAYLAGLRSRGWSAPDLAECLDMKPPAVSKRVERARKQEIEVIELARQNRAMRRAARAGAPQAGAAWQRVGAPILAYERRRAIVEGAGLPAAPDLITMADGGQLEPEIIEALQRLQATAARVNGATPLDHPDREDSRRLSELLDHLVNERGFKIYYLARVMKPGPDRLSPRALSARMERWGYRPPAPSIAGTSSGEYHHRRIGDPGQGAPRMAREQREQLRKLWAAYTRAAASGSGSERARQALVTLLRGYLQEGLTLANLAQAITTRDTRVRYGDLAQVLADAQAVVR